MRELAVAAITVIVSFIWFCHLEGEVRKDYAKAGYIVIGDVAYRITAVDQTKP